MKNSIVAAALALLAVLNAAAQQPQIVSFTCTASEVALRPNRVHVKCDSNPHDSNIVFFALPTLNASVISTTSDNATRMLQIALQQWALVTTTGPYLNIGYDPQDLSGAAYGCLNTNCRPVFGINLSTTKILPPPAAPSASVK